MTFYLRRQNKRREREPNNEIQMGAPRSAVGAAQVISWQFMAPLREMEVVGRLAGRLHSKALARKPPSECFHSRPGHQYKFSNPLYALIMSIIKTPGARASRCGPLKRYCDLNLGLDLWRGD
jgi:hypothetical protein